MESQVDRLAVVTEPKLRGVGVKAALGPEMAWIVVPEIAMFAAVPPVTNGDPAISLSDPSVGLT